jgi:hypothetical protein
VHCVPLHCAPCKCIAPDANFSNVHADGKICLHSGTPGVEIHVHIPNMCRRNATFTCTFLAYCLLGCAAQYHIIRAVPYAHIDSPFILIMRMMCGLCAQTHEIPYPKGAHHPVLSHPTSERCTEGIVERICLW